MQSVCTAMVAAMPYPSGQGTQAVIGELARGLARSGHRVHLVCYHHGAYRREEPFSVHRIRGLPFYRRLRSGPDGLKPVLDLVLAARAASVAREHGCSLIHAHNYEGALAGWLAAQMCRLPLVYHAHNLMEDELPTYTGNPVLAGAARLLGIGLDRVVPRLGDRVIALHDKLAGALQDRGVVAGRMVVVPPGIDAAFWGAEPPAGKAARPTVVYAGNLDAYQDLPVLFNAMQLVAERIAGARLLVLTPNDASEGRRLAEAHGAGHLTRVIFTPDAGSTRRELVRAHVAASPRSSWSGFPVKNLNAAAAGLPVVACRGGAFGVEDKRTGLVVPDRDPETMARALCQLLQDPPRAAALGQAGKQRIRESYSLDKMVSGVERVWEMVTAQVRRRA